jgi:NADH-quinone oxidoreductase subunit L
MLDDAIRWMCASVFYGTIAKAVEWVDTNIVDGAVNGTARLALYCWDRSRKLQSGNLVDYLTYFVAGVIALCFILLI